MRSSPWFLLGRGALAVVLTVGFYLLAVGTAATLFIVAFADLQDGRRIHPQIVFFCLAFGGMILWAIAPRKDRFTPPGPRLLPERNPRLFAMIREIAAATGQPVPDDVYLCHNLNAWVAQRGGVMGRGGRRVLTLGQPLLQVLTVEELRAVLGHEFGHYSGGDTRIGVWVWKTRSAIGRTIQQLGDSWIRIPFTLYGRLFMRVTQAVSRRQEFAADAEAARLTTAATAASALHKVCAAGVAHESYWNGEVVPILQNGFRPPLAEGFSRFLQTPNTVAGMRDYVGKELASGKSDVYDSHPSLRERVSALGVSDERALRPVEGPQAATLVEAPAELEPALLAALAGRGEVDKLKAVSWDEVGAKVWIDVWRRGLKDILPDMVGLKVADIARLSSEPAAIMARLGRHASMQGGEMNARKQVAQMLAAAVALRLARDGWDIAAPPGAPVAMTRGTARFEPFTQALALASDGSGTGEWLRQCGDAGVGDLPLVLPIG